MYIYNIRIHVYPIILRVLVYCIHMREDASSGEMLSHIRIAIVARDNGNSITSVCPLSFFIHISICGLNTSLATSVGHDYCTATFIVLATAI